MCFRFYQHTVVGVSQLKNRIIDVYEGYDRKDGQKGDFGGDEKYGHIISGTPAVILSDQTTALARLLRDLAAILQQHYLAVEPQPQARPRTEKATSSARVRGALAEVRRFAASRSLPKKSSALPATPSVSAEEMSHDKVLAAFTDALEDVDGWDAVKKTEDQFACFKASAVIQRSISRIGQASSGSKRGSEEDLLSVDPEQANRLKRARSGTSRLASLSEDFEVFRQTEQVD